MATNLAIDDSLLDHARSVGGYKTKRETVNEALREFIQRRERLGLLQLARKLEYDPKYDYKKERRVGGWPGMERGWPCGGSLAAGALSASRKAP